MAKLLVNLVLVSVCLFLCCTRTWCQTPVAGKEVNLCRYTMTSTRTVLRKNITTTTEYHTKNCGIPENPTLQCPETRVNSRIYWYPIQKKKYYKATKCCPGWSGYVTNVGCTKKTKCGITLPQGDTKMCQIMRIKRLMYSRSFYKLTAPIKPDDPNRKTEDIIFPTLNQSKDAVLQRTMMDPYTAHWFNVYFHGMLLRNNKTLSSPIVKQLMSLRFDNYNDYAKLFEFFMPLQEQFPLPYFRLPSLLPEFRNIIYNETWKSDRAFVEQRLAGLNPMSLQRVTKDGKVGIGFDYLMRALNKTFDWNKALSDAIGTQETMQSAMEKGILFAVDYPIYHDIPHVPDITDENPNDNRKMMTSSSPIGLFAVSKDQSGKNELKVVAIQLNYKPDSEVRTPKDGAQWMAAKGFFQMADFAVVEIYEHLLKTHVRIEPICVCIHRHLPPTHPLSEILRIHCRGLLPTNSYGMPRLTDKFAYMHRLFGMGHVGTLQILNNGYEKMVWKDNDLHVNIKARGVDDETILPYYPYRDDGKVIYTVLEGFARDIVDLVYKTNEDIIMDYEIQNLIKELSADGSGSPDAGKGKIKGLPAQLKTKEELADIIKETIWLVVQHASVNYPIIAYGSFTPNYPTKLYQDPEHKDYGDFLPMIPKGTIPVLQTFVTLNLGTMRYDKMFDYSESLKDPQSQLLVAKYYRKVMKEIQPILEQRNKQRYAAGHLTYPYMEPKWLPNSIHT